MPKVGFIDGKMRQVDGLWDDIRVPANVVSLPGPPEPDWELFVPDKIFALAFDDTVEEEVYFNVQMPHGYKIGTTIYPHVHFSTVVPSGGNVVWGLEYTLASYLDPFFPTVLTLATGVVSAGLPWLHYVANFSPPIVNGVPYLIHTLSTMLLCRLFRDATNLNDTYPGDAFLLEIDFHYQKDDLGSVQEWVKG